MRQRFEKARFDGDDAVTSTLNLLVAMGVKVSKDEVIDRLEKHPSFPSLESVNDVLVELGLEVEATMLPLSRVRGSEPFLSLSAEHGVYLVLDSSDDGAEVVLADRGLCRWTVETASAHWSGVAIRVRAPAFFGVPSDRLRSRLRDTRFAPLLASVLLMGAGAVGGLPVSMFVLAGVGLWLGLSLDRVARGESTGWASRICTRTESGCRSILASRASRLFGLRLTDVGVSYFLAWMLAALTGLVARDTGIWTALALLSLAGGLFPILSIGLQWRAKAWCPLCLLVQAVLFSQAVMSWLFLPKLGAVSFTGMVVVAASIAASWFAWQFASRSLRRLSTLRANERRYARLARRPQAIQAIVQSAEKIAFGNLPGDLSFGASTGVRLDLVLSLGCPSCRRVFEALDASIEQLRRHARVTIRLVGRASAEDSTLWCLLPRPTTSMWSELRAAFAGEAEVPIEMARGYAAAGAWLAEHRVEAVPLLILDGHVLPSDLGIEDLSYYIRDRADLLAAVESNRRAG